VSSSKERIRSAAEDWAIIAWKVPAKPEEIPRSGQGFFPGRALVDDDASLRRQPGDRR